MIFIPRVRGAMMAPDTNRGGEGIMRDDAAEGFIEVDGAALEYRRIPAARPGRPTLVFLHEGLGCIGLWRDFPDRVAADTGCGALLYSRAGYGRSSPVPLPRPLSYHDHEALSVLPRVLDAFALDRVVLVGHSDGGTIALLHAAAEPGPRLLGAVSIAAHVFNEERAVQGIREAVAAFEAGPLRARLERLHGPNTEVAFHGWHGAWLDPAFRDWTIVPRLARIRIPLLVIQGTEDEYGTADQYETIAASSGGPVELAIFENCAHSPHRDQPDRTAAAIADFVRAVAPD